MSRVIAVLGAVLVAGAIVTGCGASQGARTRASTTTSTSTSTTTFTTIPSPTTTHPAITTTTTTILPREPAVVVRHGDARRRWIALTFDAGSDTGNTATILDLLAARHLRATFSLTGAWTRANPELVRRIAREGHTIVNHTDTHRSFTGVSTHEAPLSAEARAAQLERADAAIAALTGRTTRPWFRPPYGDVDAATPVDVGRMGYEYVLLWSVDSLGWKGLAPPEVVARCIAAAMPGAIMLLHVGSASTDAVALPAILDGLQARGYELVTVAASGFVLR